MSSIFTLDRASNALFGGAGQRFDPVARRWLDEPKKTARPGTPRTTQGLVGANSFARVSKRTAKGLETLDAIAAVTWLQRESGHPLRVPIGVIGPREATDAQLAAALKVGELLGDCRLTVLCGGRQGVMQAVCEGVARVGGLSVGLVPEPDPVRANPFVGVVIATGIGEARNALIARASFCLIAIGDSLGTLSEVALGRQFGKLVIGVEGAAKVEGVQHVAGAREAVERVAEVVLAM